MHFLQSSAWEEYLRRDGEEVLRLDGRDYKALAVRKKTPMGYYLFLPYGPVASTLEILQKALTELSEYARKHDCFFLRFEPSFALDNAYVRSCGLKQAKEIDPAHTWILDLAASEEELLAGMEKNKPRSWRNMAAKGMTVRSTQDPEEIGSLTSLLAGVAAQDNFTPQTEGHLRRQLESSFATLYLVELEGALAPIAAALVYDYDGVRYYAHAAADYEHRKLRAGTVLLVQMILDAKRAGLKTFDFWGVTTSSDPNHPWAGFTQYKKSFGGRQIDYGGTWDLPLNRSKYLLYQGLRQVNLRLRKLKR